MSEKPVLINKFNSPNFDSRIKHIVLHHTATKSLEETLDIFLNREPMAVKVSSHFIVDTNGDIYSIVDEQERAWHAGISSWGIRTGLNDTSIGIEIQNAGDVIFPKEQMDAVIELSKYLMDKYSIASNNIVGHADIAPGRKYDPSGYFDWKYLYEELDIFHGIYDSKLSDDKKYEILIDKDIELINISDVQNKLIKYGYVLDANGIYDTHTSNVFYAFNLHFVPEAFKKEKIVNNEMIVDPDNARWYSISEERLENLINAFEIV